MEKILKEVTHHQRALVASLLHRPMEMLAQQCVVAWPDCAKLNAVLMAGYSGIPYTRCLFLLDSTGKQISDNIAAEGLIQGHFGRDRSTRPYMRENMPSWGFLLSDAFISQATEQLSLAALHVVYVEDQLLGYLGAIFDLRDLPSPNAPYQEPDHWRQIKGDPSIRQLLFQQSRVESAMDRQITSALAILTNLLEDRGIFQCVIHFSSSRTTIWGIEDPFRYHILDQDALSDPDVCLAYPLQPYPADALIPADCIAGILNLMRELRLSDETIYLRSASINLFNGMISLTFSCDGSHYMRYDEFLEKSLDFWFGESE
jgi:hypothetical protein